MGVGVSRPNLLALVAKFGVASPLDVLWLKRLPETRPARFGIVLFFRAEQRLTRNNVHVNALGVIVPVRVAVRHFSVVMLRDVVLNFRE